MHMHMYMCMCMHTHMHMYMHMHMCRRQSLPVFFVLIRQHPLFHPLSALVVYG